MLKIMQGLPDSIVGIEGSGKITKNDYIDVLEPILDEALEKEEKVSLLFYLNENYEGYTPGAVFEDTAMGVKYFNVMKRCAVVTDSPLITGAVNLFAPIIPIDFKSFKISELSKAKMWLGETPETDIEFHFDSNDNILTVTPTEALNISDFETLQTLLNQVYKETDIISGVILNTQNFPGWEDLRSMLRHFEFLKDNRYHFEKVAICTDNRFIQKALPTVIKHLEDIDAQIFKYGAIDEARNWLRNVETLDQMRAV
ncbi:SpoIIAA-like protein [Halobacteriovorax sp. BALOs_7]|uniref:STAS/SEC14 domain-containing protein n=1 Tax=Halobacteriovorax sp. BALOs_7 TaxID=2109558 RepID=UPI000E9FFD77|nr:STAS/SEC14 domain-containing protein [Halobacteriovorax sp. BALOs_7]AYF44072.1 SpoIIAA-like protein [Halobacteriovorax sp. BALOs_7]